MDLAIAAGGAVAIVALITLARELIATARRGKKAAKPRTPQPVPRRIAPGVGAPYAGEGAGAQADREIDAKLAEIRNLQGEIDRARETVTVSPVQVTELVDKTAAEIVARLAPIDAKSFWKDFWVNLAFGVTFLALGAIVAHFWK